MSGVRLSRLYLPAMRERHCGRIIFISSESAYHIPPDSIHYGMTKAAQIAVARGRAAADVEREFFASFRPTSLIKRFADSAEVGNFVAYVASPLASATTGAALRVDGGTVKSAF